MPPRKSIGSSCAGGAWETPTFSSVNPICPSVAADAAGHTPCTPFGAWPAERPSFAASSTTTLDRNRAGRDSEKSPFPAAFGPRRLHSPGLAPSGVFYCALTGDERGISWRWSQCIRTEFPGKPGVHTAGLFSCAERPGRYNAAFTLPPPGCRTIHAKRHRGNPEKAWR